MLQSIANSRIKTTIYITPEGLCGVLYVYSCTTKNNDVCYTQHGKLDSDSFDRTVIVQCSHTRGHKTGCL
jgi:hypothetical protein